MKKILVIFGTRPEAIKMVPIVKALKNDPSFDLKLCVTAQHREMLDSVLSCFDITPDYDLSIMKQNQTLVYITAAAIQGLESVMQEFVPDMVIVHGDTTSALSGALTAFYNKISIAHIEAGLRSKDIRSPFPEEFNRKTISLVADLHFAPTETAVENLLNEGIEKQKIFLVGNSVIDTMLLSADMQTSIQLPTSPYILMTIHRREHSDDEILSIFRAVRRICIDNPSLSILYPIHKNPRFCRLFEQSLGDIKNIKRCDPVPTVDFHHLLRNCYLVLTDSGGIQEEASYLGKPLLVARNNTERPEGLSLGTLSMVGSDEEKIYNEVQRLLSDREEYNRRAVRCYEFGKGNTAQKIIEILKSI